MVYKDIVLYDHQKEALEKLYSGAILCGGVGSGKTYTSLFYYLKNYKELPLYIITTAKKRDENDWEKEAKDVGIEELVVDSWNNVTKYIDVKRAFFIFDEQRVVGYGKWSKSFIKIAKDNKWILLSATPGDVWIDYMPVFIANGFYKNKTDFIEQHVEYNPYVKFPQIKKYHNITKLEVLKNRILVMMPDKRDTNRIRNYVNCNYNKALYSKALNDRWNVLASKPIINASELLYILREIVAVDPDRIWNANYIISIHNRIIVFYNFNYELEILKDTCDLLGRRYYQWNGQKHEYLPDDGDWVYLVQYTAGAEGWNCISTNVILFYSLNYSYRTTAQAEGRIDRLNTPFKNLEYYYLVSKSGIDQSIKNAITKKKKFNERNWLKQGGVIF